MKVDERTTGREIILTLTEREAVLVRTLLRSIRGGNTADGPKRAAQSIDGDMATFNVEAKVLAGAGKEINVPDTWDDFEKLDPEAVRAAGGRGG